MLVQLRFERKSVITIAAEGLNADKSYEMILGTWQILVIAKVNLIAMLVLAGVLGFGFRF